MLSTLLRPYFPFERTVRTRKVPDPNCSRRASSSKPSKVTTPKRVAAVIDHSYSENTVSGAMCYLVLMALYKFVSKSSKGLVPATHDQFLASVRSPEPV